MCICCISSRARQHTPAPPTWWTWMPDTECSNASWSFHTCARRPWNGTQRAGWTDGPATHERGRPAKIRRRGKRRRKSSGGCEVNEGMFREGEKRTEKTHVRGACDVRCQARRRTSSWDVSRNHHALQAVLGKAPPATPPPWTAS